MDSNTDQQLGDLAGRRFAFFPAIRGFEHNEWTLERQTWAELCAKNVRSGQAIWVPRSHIGKISSAESPILIVGLVRELQYRAGSIVPYRAPVVSMPKPAGVSNATPSEEPEPAAPHRGTSASDRQTASLVAKVVLGALAIVLLVLMYQFSRGENPIAAFFRADSSASDQRYLSLTRDDSYHAAVTKLGAPESEEWLTAEEADLQFQALRYPARGYVVILMGGTRPEARYVGTLHDPSRRILDAARLPRGGDTSSLLRNLPDF